jgi:hypothetical protein
MTGMVTPTAMGHNRETPQESDKHPFLHRILQFLTTGASQISSTALHQLTENLLKL